MSSRTSRDVVEGATLMLALLTLLPARASAAAPKTSPDPNQVAKKRMAEAQTAPLPPSKPQRPIHRTPASFTRQMPFSEAIDILRNSTSPPLNIVVLWKEIGENAGVYRETPIGIDGVSGLRVGQCLDLLMHSLSAGAAAKLAYVVDKGVITIATTDALPAPKPVARVYDISDLVAPPGRYFVPPLGLGMGYMGYGSPMMPLGTPGGNIGAGFYGMVPDPSRAGPAGRAYSGTGRTSGIYYTP